MIEKEPSGGSALLLARIVDEAGRPIRRADLAGIELSVFELPVSEIDPGRSAAPAVIPPHDRVALDVATVVLDRVQPGGAWRVDGEGYNFRHEVDLRAAGPIRPGAEFQVCYRLTTLAGRQTTLRFHLRAVAAAPGVAPRAGPAKRAAAPGAARITAEAMR